MRCPSCKELLDLSAAKFCTACGAAVDLSPPPDPMVGQLIASRYRVTHLLAEGGMGRVYAAEQMMGSSVRKVAIKVLLAEYSGRDQDVQRLARECSTVAELEHPNTIKFYDYGETREGDLFIAMEFLSGESLSQILKAGAMPAERVDLIVGQICGSLYEAHTHGIVHRDLKPDNIILTSPGGAPDFVKVLDFGIAKRVGNKDPKLTPIGVVLGSPPYMSPEQFTMQEVDRRSDIYSFGVVAYQMLTGKLPFNASDPIEWAALHMGAQPAPIDSHNIPIPPPMRMAIHRALSKEPSARQSTMREFFAEFTIGSGSLEPGRLSSMFPLMPSQISFPAPPRVPSSVAPASDASNLEKVLRSEPPSDPDNRGISARATSVPPVSEEETKDDPNRESEVVTHVREGDGFDELPTRVRNDGPDADAWRSGAQPPQEVEPARAKDDAPETSRDVGPPAFSETTDVLPPADPDLFDTSTPARGQSAGVEASSASTNDPATIRDASGPVEIIAEEISASQLSLTPQGTTTMKADKGTIVMAASEPPPKKSMPDLIPPTLRDPVSAVRNASKRTLLYVAAALVILGAIGSAAAWFFFVRPTPHAKPKKKAAPSTQVAEASQKPLAPTQVGSAAARPPPSIRADNPPLQAPADTAVKPAEKLSPCQTAIFAAVSGKCDVAQRAYARCADDSPYRASATRAMTGLCPTP